MNMKLVGSVPVKPYLLKFIEKVEHLEPGKPIDLNNNGVIAYVFKMLLTNKTNIEHDQFQSYEQLNKEYTAKMRFKISTRMQAFNQFFLSRKSITVFDRFLRSLFHEMLLERILKGIKDGQDEKAIIYAFMKELDIEEDISYDAIKRANSRLRKSKKMPTIHQQKCLL